VAVKTHWLLRPSKKGNFLRERQDYLLNLNTVREERLIDPILNEICLDYQSLLIELNGLEDNASQTERGLVCQLENTLLALKNEILARVAK
jgi:hypothetical protein